MSLVVRKALQPRLVASCVAYTSRRAASTAETRTAGSDILPFSKIPKIPVLPFIGSGWVYFPIIGKYDFKKLHYENLKKYEEYGPIFIETFNRDLQFVNVYDPEDIVKVYRNEGRYPDRLVVESIKKYRGDKKDLYNNGGLLTTIGKEWWDVRSGVQPYMMKPKAMHAYLGPMDEVAKAFVDRMSHLRGKDGGEVQDYLEELYKWALESVSLVAFDKRLGCLDTTPNQEAVAVINSVNAIFDLLFQLEFGSLRLWKTFPTIAYKKFEKNMDYFSATALKFLEEAKKRLQQAPEDHEPTFLELMISTTKDPRDITAMVTDMVFGGIDTTSCTVGYTLYHLARNPEAQEKVYQEIKSIVKGGPLNTDTLNNLPYLKACVKEGMRLNPVAFGNGRKLAEDTVLSGYAVPAGTRILTQQYALGQLEKYFPEPKKFKPERFLRSESTHHPFSFLPFGFGPRSCIGQRIAQQEIWILLTRIIERFRVEYHHEDLGMVLRGVAIPDKPLRFEFHDRL